MDPAANADAPADLAARFSSVLSQLNGRSVSTDALFETLRLETLDWGVDRGVATEMVSMTEVAVPVSEDQA